MNLSRIVSGHDSRLLFCQIYINQTVKNPINIPVNSCKITIQMVRQSVLLKALLPVCMKYTARGES